jgi:tetratricopeptide (TPR) repeat protein
VTGDRAVQDYKPSSHEYTHLIVRRSGLKLPLWLNEGWADVFSTLRPMGKDMAVGDLLPERMKSLANDTWMDFDVLTAVDRNSPDYNEGARAGIFYAESWALAHMLFLAPEYKDKFGSFVMALNGGKSSQEACQIAFGRSSGQVFQDLRTYFDRKKIFGTVFETRIDKRPVKIEAAGVADFDARLMLADLMAANNNQNGAQIEYAKLEQEAPARADLLASIGYMALSSRDRERARGYFERAYAAGSSDSKMCYELAMLDNAAKAPAARVMPILERALKARPDFTEAKAQLGLLKVNTRDFAGGVAILTSIPAVKPQIASAVLCMLAYAEIQTGDVEGARQNMEGCRKWSKTAEETARAEKIGKFVEARSNPAVAVRPGEQLRQLTGITRSVECSDEGNRLQVSVGSRLITFDLPAVDAVELPLKPQRSVSLACGPMQPAEIGVEYAPPRSAMETSIGIVRRLNY